MEDLITNEQEVREFTCRFAEWVVENHVELSFQNTPEIIGDINELLIKFIRLDNDNL